MARVSARKGTTEAKAVILEIHLSKAEAEALDLTGKLLGAAITVVLAETLTSGHACSRPNVKV